MAAGTSIAVIAATSASVAAKQVAEAKTIACQGMVRGYEHERATLAEQRQYAECISLNAPSPPMSPAELLTIKAVIVLLFIGIAVGAWRGLGNDYDGPFFGAFKGFLAAVSGMLAAAFIAGGIYILVKT